MEDLETRFSTAVKLHRQGRESEAEAIYRELLTAMPGHPEVNHLLGVALLHLGQLTEAGQLLKAAVSAYPLRPDFRLNRANYLSSAGDKAAALAELRCALSLDPGLTEAWFNIAHIGRRAGRCDEAIAGYRRGLAMTPYDPAALAGLGGSLYEGGHGRAAVTALRRSLALHHDPVVHSGYLYVLEFDPEATPESHQRGRRRWAHAYLPAQARPAARPRDRDPERVLTIGFIAPIFDSAALMIEPFLQRHNRRQFRVVLYSNLPPQDEIGRGFDRLADRWRTVGGLPDADFDLAIREDEIDILVDTANHIGGHRLAIFAGRPAPIQVSGWAHGFGSGTRAFDYVIGDSITIPEDERGFYAERVLDVPCRSAFQPPVQSLPVSPPPSSLGQPFTLGHLGRLSKVTDETARLWHRLLATAPATRLVLKADRNTVAAGIRRVLDHLTPGIDPARIMIVGPKDRFANMADYRMIDLALDTTPVAGPLTLWESLWMGVPVIALRGTSQSARASMSILTATGIPQFIADDTEVYLRIVLDLVRDPGPLSALRRDLRGWLEASPAGNPERIAAAMSEAFRAIWRRYCASPQ